MTKKYNLVLKIILFHKHRNESHERHFLNSIYFSECFSNDEPNKKNANVLQRNQEISNRSKRCAFKSTLKTLTLAEWSSVPIFLTRKLIFKRSKMHFEFTGKKTSPLTDISGDARTTALALSFSITES